MGLALPEKFDKTLRFKMLEVVEMNRGAHIPQKYSNKKCINFKEEFGSLHHTDQVLY